jgi:hypothetical protein
VPALKIMVRQEESSFSEEKEAKRLLLLRRFRWRGRTPRKAKLHQKIKVFLLLFLQKKKKCFLFECGATASHPAAP